MPPSCSKLAIGILQFARMTPPDTAYGQHVAAALQRFAEIATELKRYLTAPFGQSGSLEHYAKPGSLNITGAADA